jgi:hypothetical protein
MLKHKILGGAALLLFGPVASAIAGSVYVPLATDHTIEGVRYRTQVWATNTDTTLRQFTTYFIPSDTDGTDRPENWGASTAVAPGTMMLLGTVAGSGETGMLEISGAPHVVVTARMVPTLDGVTGLGAAMPVVGSQNLFAADATAHLQGWIRSGDLRSDLGVVNLGAAAASCAVDVFRSDGTQIQSTAVVSVPPLGHRQFDDALAILGEQAIAAVRSETTCDQPFYVYLRSYDRTTGDLHFTLPSVKLADSTLNAPGVEPPPPPPPVQCGAGSHCFEYLTTPYIPTNAAQNHKFFIDVPSGSYDLLKMQMDVFHGGWQNPPDGLHNIFWFVKDRNFNMYGYVNLRGPGRNEIMLRHGLGTTASQKAKILRPFNAVPGETYHFDYTFDTLADRITLVVSHRGEEVMTITDRPNVNRIHIEPGERLAIALSFIAGLNPNEPPTFGWRYSNLRVQLGP